MNINFINSSYRRFYAQHKDEIDQAITKCLENGDLTLRQDVVDFENHLAEYIGTKYAIGVGSGTDALFLSLLALGIGKGDEVITVSNTFIATIQAIVHTGATPILIDVNDDEQMNVEQIEQAINQNTKAIIPVHYTGKTCAMDKIMYIADQRKLFVVEDACQALGAKVWNRYRAGSYGDLGCFSFNTAKMMGAYGDAGAITTNDKNLYGKLGLLRNHWNMAQLSVIKEDFPQPEMLGWGWKSRLDNVQAAVLNVKMKYLDQMINRREEIANRYLTDLDGLPFKLPTTQNGQVWQEFHIEVKERDKFVKFMKEQGIELLVRDTIPNHKQPGLGLDHFSLPRTERFAQKVVRLPLYPELNNSEILYIIEKVKEFYAR